jgi:hypothetical protein
VSWDCPSAGRALTLITAMDAARVGVGHARDAESSEITAVVSCPDEAASWLRQARALTAAGPDAWLIAGPIASLRRVCDRLSTSTDWDAARTVALATVGEGAVVGRADSIVTAGQRRARVPTA